MNDATIIDAADNSAPLRSPRFRLRAFAIHLGISLTILAVLLYLLFYYWFPDYLFDTDGGWQALRVIAGVDIVLGPVLTLIAASPKKTLKSLRMDFIAIGLIQASALSWGVWLAWDNRPYAIFWNDGAFQSLPYSAFSNEPDAKKWIETKAQTSPQTIFLDFPADPIARDTILKRHAGTGHSAAFDPALFQLWPGGDTERVLRHGDAVMRVINQNPALGKQYAAELAQRGIDPATVIPVPVRSSYQKYFLLLSRTSLTTVTALDLEPSEKLLLGFYRLGPAGPAEPPRPPAVGGQVQ